VRRSLLVWLGAFVPRAAYIVLFPRPFDGTYWALSTSLLTNRSLSIDGEATAAYEPVYPAFLAAARLLTDAPAVVQLLQAAVAALGALFLYFVARDISGRDRIGILAATLFAVYPLSIHQAAVHSETALLTTLLIAWVWSFVNVTTLARAICAGALLGLVVLTRTMTLPLIACSGIMLARERRAWFGAAGVVASLLVVLPMALRNHAVSGGFSPTRSGLNLYIGNMPLTADLTPRHDVDLLQGHAAAIVERELPELASLPPAVAERAADAVLTRRALDYMLESPQRTAFQKVANVAYVFWPTLVPLDIADEDTVVRVGPDGVAVVEGATRRPWIEPWSYTATYVPVAALALAGVWMRRRSRRRDAILWSVAATFVAVHVWYFPATRYTAPMAFVMQIFAAVALDAVLARSDRAIEERTQSR
jgi:hypothetical protein